MGALSLIGAVTRACDSDMTEAWRMQNAARAVAERLGQDRNEYWTTFGHTQVAIHVVAVNVEFGQLDAERVAAEEVGYPAVVWEMVQDLLRRERKRATPRLRPLAQRIGILDH